MIPEPFGAFLFFFEAAIIIFTLNLVVLEKKNRNALSVFGTFSAYARLSSQKTHFHVHAFRH